MLAVHGDLAGSASPWWYRITVPGRRVSPRHDQLPWSEYARRTQVIAFFNYRAWITTHGTRQRGRVMR
jgi:hypothetical protein